MCYVSKQSMDDMKIKGINLGNWLVLEKWMSQVLFLGLEAEDESAFYEDLSEKEAQLRLHMHRSYYIQERDFQHIRAMGLNLVRIPVPHFIFGDYGPGIGCIQYLDQAFVWAEKYGLKILIDLHTAPDSQNGFDNGGLSGVVKWHMPPEEYPGVVIDTHMYLFSEEAHMPDRKLSSYEGMIREKFKERLKRAKKFHPVIVGEWCIANKSEGIKELPEKEKAEAYRKIGRWKMDAWSACDGWIFWSYKLHAAERNDWDFQRAVDAGWLELSKNN